jgi:hypothetical protein
MKTLLLIQFIHHAMHLAAQLSAVLHSVGHLIK